MAKKLTDNWVHYELEADSAYAQAAGEFILKWGSLEAELDLLVPSLFRVNQNLAQCITANLGTKAKIEMLQSALSMIAPALPKDLVDKLHDELQGALSLSSRYRNFLAHGRPDFSLMTHKDGSPGWMWTRTSARKTLSILWPDTSEAYWLRASQLVGELSKSIYKSSWALSPIIHKIPTKKWRELCQLPEPKEQ